VKKTLGRIWELIKIFGIGKKLVEKFCKNCKFEKKFITEEPCINCEPYKHQEWQPKL